MMSALRSVQTVLYASALLLTTACATQGHDKGAAPPQAERAGAHTAQVSQAPAIPSSLPEPPIAPVPAPSPEPKNSAQSNHGTPSNLADAKFGSVQGKARGDAGGLGSVGYGIGGGGTGHGYGGGRIAAAPVRQTQLRGPAESVGSEAYEHYRPNAWTLTEKDNLSTFAADVDNASYTIARRKLGEGILPPKDSIRVEEFVNFYDYAYPAPTSGPFSVTMDAAPAPWSPDHHILRVGVATKAKSLRERAPANLVFLVDVSGSMSSPDKLPLAQRALRLLTEELADNDTVSLVTYAGNERVVLEPTSASNKAAILAAIEDLQSGGSTAMGAGIDLAYKMAARGNKPGVNSRVIVLSDGDANVGRTSHEEILGQIQGYVKEGITLSTVGFGMGNYKDTMMEQLANKGNGNNYYVDGQDEAKRIFVDKLSATLEVVAKDVKLQVDFNPAKVARYRLVGYENRDIADRDFRNDKVDAGEIGAGHQVTALYELELTAEGKLDPAGMVTTMVRHKAPTAESATEVSFTFAAAAMAQSIDAASADLRFATAIALFADKLRGNPDLKDTSLAVARALAAGAAATRRERAELVTLIDKAIALTAPAHGTTIARPAVAAR